MIRYSLKNVKSNYKNITNVYILQGNQNKSHHHTVYVKDKGHTHTSPSWAILRDQSGGAIYYAAHAYQEDYLVINKGYADIVVNDDNSDINKNITANSGEDEARPSNSTYIIWRRTA